MADHPHGVEQGPALGPRREDRARDSAWPVLGTISGAVDLQDALVRFWNESAHYYEVNSEMNTMAEGVHPDHARIAAFLNSQGASSLLDVGCGTGHIASVLAELAPQIDYTGIDLASAAVEGARRAERPGRYLVADTAALPFETATFDAVVSLYALEHFTRPHDSLREMVRVARPGGVIGIFSMNYDRPLGTVSSVRLGLRGKPRLHPANVAVYGARRAAHALRQLSKHIRYATDRRFTSFEMVERPLVLEGDYQVDFDAVHVVSGRSILRVLEREGCQILTSNIPTRLVAKRPVGLEVFARREE
jgi:ubiquinone/menaquinone biosynthesis C-methylase UbiE